MFRRNFLFTFLILQFLAQIVSGTDPDFNVIDDTHTSEFIRSSKLDPLRLNTSIRAIVGEGNETSPKIQFTFRFGYLRGLSQAKIVGDFTPTPGFGKLLFPVLKIWSFYYIADLESYEIDYGTLNITARDVLMKVHFAYSGREKVVTMLDFELVDDGQVNMDFSPSKPEGLRVLEKFQEIFSADQKHKVMKDVMLRAVELFKIKFSNRDPSN